MKKNILKKAIISLMAISLVIPKSCFAARVRGVIQKTEVNKKIQVTKPVFETPIGRLPPIKKKVINNVKDQIQINKEVWNNDIKELFDGLCDLKNCIKKTYINYSEFEKRLNIFEKEYELQKKNLKKTEEIKYFFFRIIYKIFVIHVPMGIPVKSIKDKRKCWIKIFLMKLNDNYGCLLKDNVCPDKLLDVKLSNAFNFGEYISAVNLTEVNSLRNIYLNDPAIYEDEKIDLNF